MPMDPNVMAAALQRGMAQQQQMRAAQEAMAGQRQAREMPQEQARQAQSQQAAQAMQAQRAQMMAQRQAQMQNQQGSPQQPQPQNGKNLGQQMGLNMQPMGSQQGLPPVGPQTGKGTGITANMRQEQPMPLDPQVLAQALMKPTPRPALLNDAPNPVYAAAMKASPYYKEFQANFGEAPALSGGDYNLQRAWQLGLKPERDPYDKNRLHWPDRAPTGEMLKTPDHPTVWMQHFMDATGGKNPEALGLKDYGAARAYLGRDFVPADVLSAIQKRGVR